MTEEGTMTGPEHYRAAEKLLEQVADLHGRLTPVAALEVLVAEAQGHATLAIAAATAQRLRAVSDLAEAAQAWDEVLR